MGKRGAEQEAESRISPREAELRGELIQVNSSLKTVDTIYNALQEQWSNIDRGLIACREIRSRFTQQKEETERKLEALTSKRGPGRARKPNATK